MVWVGDYQNSKLYVFTIDLSDSTPIDAHEVAPGRNWISLDSDKYGNSTPLSPFEYCNPSTVRHHESSGDTFVLCQTRDSIIRIETTTDPCNPSWERGEDQDEARLQQYLSGAAPSCDSDPALQDCTNCQPHTIEFDHNLKVGSEWLFVGLTNVGQIVAVEQDNLAHQRLIYRRSLDFQPNDFIFAPSCNPNAIDCVYP